MAHGCFARAEGMDKTVRVWDAETSPPIPNTHYTDSPPNPNTNHAPTPRLALLQEHTRFVCVLQLSRVHQVLVTGGSDGRVAAFSLGDEAGEGMFDFERRREMEGYGGEEHA
ncbi:hypothetical protein H0H92_002336 [Tricholoma furcatifolium]|nr:hypothetical protein H0H92_002336 [Tricholoma furcatifolium]